MKTPIFIKQTLDQKEERKYIKTLKLRFSSVVAG